ncbi:hypothetical protein M404DRAFT_369736 [Pisolithus tinctorius Marx 270]|uniref:Uncharacterized protein n=1 Tax=Pisolithus tinctorius Marx 270 TaxID=870435 RepID=A0A0C3JB27_PISTI|nr:hypothetical protein M404DRAFT_369736 [Pisolithus tinctorius Marx 270]
MHSDLSITKEIMVASYPFLCLLFLGVSAKSPILNSDPGGMHQIYHIVASGNLLGICSRKVPQRIQ